MLRFVFIALALLVCAVAVVVLLAGAVLLVGGIAVYRLASRRAEYRVIGPTT